MIVSPGNCQHIGTRTSQQDAFGFSDKDARNFVAHGGVLAVIADGMGGMANGGEASRLAVRTFLDSYMAKPCKESVPDALSRSLDDANAAVVRFAIESGQELNTGTTLVAAVVFGDGLHWISVGDSRLYLCRRCSITLITEDHVYAEDLDRAAAAGHITPEEAAGHIERNALTSYLGQPQPERIDRSLRSFPLQAGDRLLLCSDGLYTGLDEQEMAQELAKDPQQAAENLVGKVLVKQRPGQDNLTVAIFACDTAAPNEFVAVPTSAVPRPQKIATPLTAIALGLLGATAIGYGWHASLRPAEISPAPVVAAPARSATVEPPPPVERAAPPSPPLAAAGADSPSPPRLVAATPRNGKTEKDSKSPDSPSEAAAGNPSPFPPSAATERDQPATGKADEGKHEPPPSAEKREQVVEKHKQPLPAEQSDAAPQRDR